MWKVELSIWQLTLFQSPPALFQYVGDFQLKKHKMMPQIRASTFMCLLDHAYEAPLANNKMERQRWPEEPCILGRSGIQYVAMVTTVESVLWSTFSRMLLQSNISDINCLRYLSSSYLIKIWLTVWRHQLANLHILKLEYLWNEKQIFENSKQHLSSYTDYFSMFQNGLDRKHAIFVIVLL